MRLVDPHFRFEDAWVLPADPERIWSLLQRTERYSEWWPWLRDLRTEGLAVGAVTRTRVRAPLGYSLAVDVIPAELEPPHRLVADVHGDVAGRVELTLRADGQGSCVGLVFEAELRRPALRAVSGIAHRPLAWGHDWVISRGIRTFRRRALGA